MNLRKAKRAIRQVAKSQGLSEKQVVETIEKAIAEGISASRRDGDLRAVRLWREIPRKGEPPTAYELVAYLSGKVEKFECGET